MLTGKSLVGWFKDSCDFNKKGKAVRGPGFFCWAYLFLLIIGVVLSIIITLYSTYKDVKQDEFDISFTIYSIVSILWGIIIISFMYGMCFICRPWTGLIVVILVGIIYRLVQNYIFKDSYDKMIKKTLSMEKDLF